MERPCNYTILGHEYKGFVHGKSKDELDEEEEVLRKAVDALKKKIIEYQNVYPQVKDNVMILSLVALDYANEFLKAKRAEKKNPNGMALKSINDMVLDALK